MTQALCALHDLHVHYGAVEVLKGITLHVDEGRIVALIGANGVGKTTTLMAISGIAPVSHGIIQFDGQQVQGLPSDALVRKGITHVPEGRRIFPRLTVRENLLVGAEFRTDRSHMAQEMDQIFELFPLLHKRQKQFGGTLSGGEQQMLAIARGLMARPKLLLLDEPSLGLAPKMVTHLFALIRKIHENGMTILLVEQNAYQALQIADSAYVLETGRVVLHGSAASLREDPSVKAAYLGG